MGKYFDQSDLELALSPQTVAELFNDQNTGELNDLAIASIVDRAEAEVDSRLVGFYDSPSLNLFDRLLKHAGVTFGMAFSFERHPEYVRQFGENQRTNGLYSRAEKLMEQVQAGLRRLPDQTAPATAAHNSGGIVYDRGPRFSIDSTDGTANGDGF